MFKDVEKDITIVRDCIKCVPERFKTNNEELTKLDLEAQDLLHLIEFKNLDVQRGYKVYKELQKIKQRRRELKNENELLQPVVKTLEGMADKTHELDRAIGRIRKVKSNQDKRVYTFKVRKDLKKVWSGGTE